MTDLSHLPSPAQRTASFVVMQRRLGHAARRRAVPRARPPTLVESDYAARLVAIVGEWRAAVAHLLQEIPGMVDSMRRARGDADDVVRRATRLGLAIAIENPAGSVRRWTDGDGTEGSTTMRWDYGCVEGALGADGEDVDVYLGPIDDPEWVHVVHQQSKASGFASYDEDKVMLGWPSADAAEAAYKAQYDDPRFFGGMTVLSAADFVDRLRRADGGKITAADRTDAGEMRNARVLLERARDRVAASSARVAPDAARAADQTQRHHKAELDRQTLAGLGAKLPVVDRGLPDTIDHFVHENVGLIRSLGGRTLDDLEKTIANGFRAGDRHDTIGDEIERRFGIAETHARLIARDQIAKLNAHVTRSRHRELGVGRFRWISMHDSRVRAHHEAMTKRNGGVWSYEGPGKPSFFPGDEILCRCGEEPLFDDILDLVDELLAA